MEQLQTNTFVNDVAKTFFNSYANQFGGPGSQYVQFQVIDDSARRVNVIFNSFVGRILYMVGGILCGSKKMQLKLYDSQLYRSCWNVLAPWMTKEVWFCESILPAFLRARVRLHGVVPMLYAFEYQVLDTNSSKKCAVLWEHLDGFTMCDSSTLLDYQHLSMMARKIGQFHAFTFCVRARHPNFTCMSEPYYIAYRPSEPVVEILKRCLQPLIQAAANSSDTKYIEAVGRLQTLVADFGPPLMKPCIRDGGNACRVVCHKHYTQLNVAFKHESGVGQLTDMRIINWQWVGFASLGVDLVLLLVADGHQPRQHLQLLLNDYRTALSSSISVTNVTAPTYEQILNEVKICMPVALHIMGKRVLSSTTVYPSGERPYPPYLWNDQRITDTYKFMIEFDLI